MSVDDSVGYGKPPQRSRFKKGESGNPNGRPKATPNAVTALLGALSEKIVIQENGKRKKITKGEAIMKQAVNRAASGDHRAVQQLISFFRIFGDKIAIQDERSEGPVIIQVVGVESDGNGRPKYPGICETDENGKRIAWEDQNPLP